MISEPGDVRRCPFVAAVGRNRMTEAHRIATSGPDPAEEPVVVWLIVTARAALATQWMLEVCHG